jgi:hypothetical protein
MINASNPNFTLAKQQMLHGLEKFVRFSNDMDRKFPGYGFKPFIQKLGNLKSIMQSASGPCFSIDQIHEIEKFSLHLSSSQNFINSYFSHKGFLPRLQEFWNLRQAIVNTGKTEEIVLWRLDKKGTSQNNFSAIGDSIKRAFQVTNTTNSIIDAILNQGTINILSITSILLALIIRVEAHEYEIQNMIAKAEKYMNLNYDIQEMLSVNSKIRKGNGWRSDTRAIRDAVSHAHFIINKKDKGYMIHFKNTEEGYNFDKTFTEKDMLFFYQDYDRSIAIQTLLLNSALITDFLIREFKN